MESSDGKDSTRSGIRELEESGYLTREKVRNEDGTFEIIYTLFESPHRGGKSAMDTTLTVAGNPPSENPPSIKERDTKKDNTVNTAPTLDVPSKKELIIPKYEKLEDIPGFQDYPPVTKIIFTSLYELGYKLPLSKKMEKMREDIMEHLRLAGFVTKNPQGYEQVMEFEFKTEMRRFVNYWKGEEEKGKGKKDYWMTFLNRCNSIHTYKTKK